MSRRTLGIAASAVALIALGAGLTGCQQVQDIVAPPTQTVLTGYEFDPNGGAAGNLDFFTQTLSEAASAAQAAGGSVSESGLRSSVEQAGFAGWPMESTSDITTLSDVGTDFRQIAVLGPDGLCLIGQVRNDNAYSAVVAEPLSATGTCLIGVQH